MTWHLGVLVSHPIQYLSPWFRHLAQRLDLEVFYAHRQDAGGQSAAGFGVEFDWDTPLLDGYQNRFLTNIARHPGLRSFGGCDTPEIYQIIKTGRFDAFLVFGWNRKSSIQAILACRQAGTPVLMRGDSQLLTTRSRLKAAAKFIPYRLLLPRLDAHLYVGKRNKEYLQHYGVPEDRLFFVPHFVDNDYFSESAQRGEIAGECSRIREEAGIPRSAFVFVYVGKMIPEKRPQDFVTACLKVFRSPESADVHAVLIGDGPLRSSLEDLGRPCADRIHFAGFRNQTQLPFFYRASDGVVLPGKESWGLVVNEGAACGIPSIVSNAAGCAPDMIDGKLTGLSYPVGDSDALANRMLTLIATCRDSRSSVRQALAEKAKAYSMERATDGLETALEAVAGTSVGVSELQRAAR